MWGIEFGVVIRIVVDIIIYRGIKEINVKLYLRYSYEGEVRGVLRVRSVGFDLVREDRGCFLEIVTV